MTFRFYSNIIACIIIITLLWQYSIIIIILFPSVCKLHLVIYTVACRVTEYLYNYHCNQNIIKTTMRNTTWIFELRAHTNK